MRKTYVVDASVAAKWLFEEHDSALAATVRGWPLIAPTLLWLECGSVIWNRTRRGLLDAREVPAVLAYLQQIPVELIPMEHRLDLVLRLAVELAHPIYDCAYLALAVANDLRVVTADRRFVAAARRHPDLGPQVLLLSELAH